jgi:hypothetical protein
MNMEAQGQGHSKSAHRSQTEVWWKRLDFVKPKNKQGLTQALIKSVWVIAHTMEKFTLGCNEPIALKQRHSNTITFHLYSILHLSDHLLIIINW